MSEGRDEEPSAADLELFRILQETLARMPEGDRIFEELQQRARSASSAEEFVEEIFGGEDVVRELLDETRDWPLGQHQARIVEIRAEAEELDDEDSGDTALGIDLAYASEFHEQAVELLRDRGLATLAEAGEVEATVAELMRRLREAGGLYAPPDLSDDPFDE